MNSVAFLNILIDRLGVDLAENDLIERSCKT